ncbi:MAG TPA: hypothetical protein VG103_03915 [Chthoniobacterales bacterium]|nr:hypothetical protein [Chthoniobacterales bacterium]
MRLPRFRYVILLASVVGGVLPLLIMVGFWLHTFSFAGERLFYIWPSSILLMAMNSDHAAQSLVVLGVSIAVNIFLYFLVFTVLWSFAWVLRRWRASGRDGTTI